MTGEESRYPYRFDRTTSVGEVRARFGELEPGAETDERVRIAGRLMTVRSHGKVAFADLQDESGRIQLFAQHGVLGDEGMASFTRLGVGDIVGAAGEVVNTRRGELSIRVDEAILLAECTRPMPEKWRGMTDVEGRYRQRYLDLLLNPDVRRVVQARADANTAIRSLLDGRGFIEVETPLLQPVASGAVARPFVTHHNALDIDLYLRVAPELFLKRLLIGGLERVYELNRSFRNEGISTRHNPEFSMLEAYEAYVDFTDTMALVEDLVKAVAVAVCGGLRFGYQDREIDLEPAFRRVTMFEAIAECTGRDLEPMWRNRAWDDLRAAARALGSNAEDRTSPGVIVAEIYETHVERAIWQPTFVVGFPTDVSPLAKDHRSLEGFTEHADLLIAGLEVAPIYSELNDPAEQRRRFEQQVAARSEGDEEGMLPDEEFLVALAYGMPPAGGFGLGIDRLLTILLDLVSIREVILFPVLRPDPHLG